MFLVLALCWMVQASAGSLYTPGEYRALAKDHRAGKVGDSLVVLVYESATATNKTDTSINKSSTVNVTAGDGHNTVGGNLNTRNAADGGGMERRSGEVIARVSATVVDILPSGEYVIRGRQHIVLNNESQMIVVEGRIRPTDIDRNNSIISNRIADATIEFTGQGLLSSREKPGIVSRLINWLF